MVKVFIVVRYLAQLKTVFRYHTNKLLDSLINSFLFIFIQIFFAFQQCKIFENQLRFDRVIMKSLMLPFYGTQCIYKMQYNIAYISNIRTIAGIRSEKSLQKVVIWSTLKPETYTSI